MVRRGGATLVKREPVFSKDGKRLLVCTACTVTVYSVQTGEVLTQLKGHTGVVSNVVVVDAVSICHCWTAGQDGTVRFWDFATGVLLRTVDVGYPVHSMVIPELRRPRAVEKGEVRRKLLVAFLSVSWRKEGKKDEEWKGRIICHNLTTGKAIVGHLAKTISPQALYVSPAGGLVGMLDGPKIWIWMVPETTIDSASVITSTVLHHTRMLTVLAFNITETKVAAGDTSGRVLLWENVGDRKFAVNSDVGKVSGKKGLIVNKGTVENTGPGGGVRGDDDAKAMTTYHWHAHEVKFLLFTIDGVYLLSGGLEGVLVIWQLETGKRQFLPRLGGPVVAIAPSLHPSLFAVSCRDNSVKLVNIGTMEVERNIQGIKPPFPTPKKLALRPSRASIEPLEGKIVVPTHNLSLQFYDAVSDRHVAEVQVTPRNYVTGGDKNVQTEGPSTCVTHVAFSGDGCCMATVDIRIAEHGIGGGASLKFWERLPGKLQFTVNTQVDEPYEISALSFHSRELMAVSCSNTEFKVWVPHGWRKVSELRWKCRSVGSYRQRPILAAAFSSDGSLLAVAASELLTLWNPATNTLIKVLSNSNLSQPINHLAFVYDSNCLVAASSGERPVLTVWDLSTVSVRWSQSIRVEELTVDPARSNFAVLAAVSAAHNEGLGSKDAVLALFSVDSPTPLQYWTVRDGLGGTVLFCPEKKTSPEAPTANVGDDSKTIDLISVSTPSKGRLTIITRGREFVVFNPYQEEEDMEELVIRDVQVPESEVPSAFTAMYGKAVQPSKQDASPDVLSALSRAPWGTLLDGPSHVLPSLAVVCIPFMDSLMKKRTEQT